ncbi:condensation domain-containing protein [Micromonospora sp. DT62]|uniref:condensation domain-containing protein n=1 Tax=Micromonospora sp. DT62 TaxID=3416521 RepID=UPI003CF1F6E4
MAIDAPLTYGQLSTWRSMETFATDRLMEVNVSATWDVRGLTADTVLGALGALARRHESLRTTYHVVDDQPVQRIHDQLPLRIEQVDHAVRDPADPAATLRALHQLPFPVLDDPGWHGRLVSVAGQPQFLALSLSHMVVDLWAIQELEQQFRAVVTDPGAGSAPAPRSRELALAQRSDSWQSRRRRAETYWRRLLTDGPVRNLPAPPAGRAAERRIQATLRSHHLAVLVAQAAKAHSVSQQSVVMAATAVALAQFVDRDRIMMSLMSANRFDPEWQPLIGTLNQLVPLVCRVDPDSTLAQYLKRTHFNAMLAYRSGSYDVDRAEELAKEIGSPDGTRFTHDCWFNYISEPPREVPDDARSAGTAELSWDVPPRNAGHPFYARVHGDGQQWIGVTLRVDPDVLGADAVVRALRVIAETVRRSVTDPQARLGSLDDAGTVVPEPALFPGQGPAPAGR